MLPRAVRFIIVILLFPVFMGLSSAIPRLVSAASTAEFELPLVVDYPYKIALYEYFSGRYPSFDELLKPEPAYSTSDPNHYLGGSGDDNLTLMAELSAEYKVYLGNLYQLFILDNVAGTDTSAQPPVAASVLSMLKGRRAYSRPARPAGPAALSEGARDVPGSIWLLDKLYTHSYYSDLMRISRKELLSRSATGVAAYFRGITLLAISNPADATLELQGVPASSPLYPYARVAFAQALFDNGDLSGAERELKALLISASLGVELREKVRLLMGQLYFEEDLFSKALMEFMNIPRSSYYYRQAIVGTAWALMKNGTFETAVGMLKDLKPKLPYDGLEWEVQVMLAYGYMQLDLHQEALVLFESLLREVTTARENLEKMSKDSLTPARYLDYLLQGGFPSSLKGRESLRDERMYFAMLSEDGGSKILRQEYAVIRRLRTAIRGKRADIAERRIYFENLISGMQGLFTLVDMESRLIKTILVDIDRRVDPDKDPRDNINRFNLDFFKDVEEGLYDHWLKIKEREISVNEREVVRLLLYDVGESLDCVKTSLICTIVDMADDKKDEELSSERLNELTDIMDILEAIALDIENVRNGDFIEYEKSIKELRKTVIIKRKAAEAGIVHLDAMDARLRNFLDSSDIATRGRMLAIVKGHMKRRVKGFKDELTELRAHIVTGLISSQKVVEEMRADER